MKKKKHYKRKIKKLPFIVLLLLLFIGSFLLFKNISTKPTTSNTLTKIGYTKEEERKIHTLSQDNQTYIENEEYISILNELINNNDFKEENLQKYIEFSQITNLDSNDIIFVINGEYDTTLSYTKDVIAVMKTDYFIKDNLPRYIAYMNDNKELSSKDIVTNVNSNIDYDFYTHVENADTSKGNLMLVNKYYKLANTYVPENLVTVDSKYGRTLPMEKEAYEAFKVLFEDARKEGLHIWVRSPYRSYQTQNSLYESYAARDGYSEADTYSARPGYSEHQTGLGLDVVADDNSLGNFENTKEFTWMKDNAYKYGFILRYPKDKEYITGYMYEPWHYRYVGKDVAKDIYEKNLTFEEYYAYYIK